MVVRSRGLGGEPWPVDKQHHTCNQNISKHSFIPVGPGISCTQRSGSAVQTKALWDGAGPMMLTSTSIDDKPPNVMLKSDGVGWGGANKKEDPETDNMGWCEDGGRAQALFSETKDCAPWLPLQCSFQGLAT